MITDKRYTSRDVQAVRSDLIDYFKGNAEQMSDYSASDLIMIYIEALSGVSDFLNFYLDNQANETSLLTAKQPKNIKAGLLTMNYKLEGVRSAVGSVNITLNGYVGDTGEVLGEALVPIYSEISTVGNNPVFYMTTEDSIS